MGESLSHFDESEMRSFGYDPNLEEDRSQRAQIEPRLASDLMSQKAMGLLGCKSFFEYSSVEGNLSKLGEH